MQMLPEAPEAVGQPEPVRQETVAQETLGPERPFRAHSHSMVPGGFEVMS